VKIGVTDIHYIGKEANELEEQVFLGFGPEAQPEYGMEGGAYQRLLGKVREAITVHGASAVSMATGITDRYLRDIRAATANVSVQLLRRVDAIIPNLEAARVEHADRNREVLEWGNAQRKRIGGLRAFAREIGRDPADLSKELSGRRKPSRALLDAYRALNGCTELQ
jgi:hypothetical protein